MADVWLLAVMSLGVAALLGLLWYISRLRRRQLDRARLGVLQPLINGTRSLFLGNREAMLNNSIRLTCGVTAIVCLYYCATLASSSSIWFLTLAYDKHATLACFGLGFAVSTFFLLWNCMADWGRRFFNSFTSAAIALVIVLLLSQLVTNMMRDIQKSTAEKVEAETANGCRTWAEKHGVFPSAPLERIPYVALEDRRVVCLYSYWEPKDSEKGRGALRRKENIESLKYLLRHISPYDPVMYLIIVQGHTISVPIPAYDNIIVFPRENNCWDFGAYGDALKTYSLVDRFDYFIFINPSVRGPFLPSYMPGGWHWSRAFTDRIRGDVGVVGTSIACITNYNLAHVGCGPRIEGMAFAVHHDVLRLQIKAGVFSCNTKPKGDDFGVIHMGEYMMTLTALKNGYNVASLQLAYSHFTTSSDLAALNEIDWRNPRHWQCNHAVHPTRWSHYDGITMAPLETIFHKWHWDDIIEQTNEDLVDRYTYWATSILNAAVAGARPRLPKPLASFQEIVEIWKPFSWFTALKRLGWIK